MHYRFAVLGFASTGSWTSKRALFSLIFVSLSWPALAQNWCRIDPLQGFNLPPLFCPSPPGLFGNCQCPIFDGSGRMFVGHVVQNGPTFGPIFTSIGAPAQQTGVQCARQSQGNISTFVSCAGQQVILPESTQMVVDCAARSGGSAQGFAICMGNGYLGNVLNEEQQIGLQCVAETNGQPYAAAACAATRLTQRELYKCYTNGFGGPDGCFGDNNDLVGRNGWTARTFQNVVADIQRGPGPTNDLVGANGFVVRTVQNIQNDIQNGPGPNNDLVGCNGWVNKNVFGGSC
jgi:hypothetical protein